jgi:hypothetical protein
MSFIVPPNDGFATVHDLGAFRRRRPRRLPAEVVEQLHVAAQLQEELQEAGVELRFEAPGAGARVRAVLTDADGNELREVSLSEVVELELEDLGH